MSEKPEHRDGQLFEHTVVPGSDGVIAIRVEPNSVCHLSHPDSEVESIQVDADSHGNIRLHLGAAPDAQPEEFVLDEMGNDGTVTRHRLRVTADPDHWTVTGGSGPAAADSETGELIRRGASKGAQNAPGVRNHRVSPGCGRRPDHGKRGSAGGAIRQTSRRRSVFGSRP